ncbi:MAG: amidohydrolase family protein, partial [Candidatus Latescibacterota bacterium]|nr:amidohydrolase family protein [Candidatus Latescibacterota bacterium]
MIIDAHNHPNWHGHDAGKILANMDEQGIDQMWLFSWEVPADEYDPSYHRVLPPTGDGIPLEDVLAVGKSAPDRFVMGYMPHPKRPDAIDRLKAAVEIHGVRLASELKVRLPFDDPDAIRLYQFCGEQRLPITIHLDYPIDHGKGAYPRPNWWYGGSIESLERSMSACPETLFIGHAPGFWAHISNDDRYDKEAYPKGPVLPGGRISELLRTYQNLFADLSAG